MSVDLEFSHFLARTRPEFVGRSLVVGEALGCHVLSEILELVDDRIDLCDLDRVLPTAWVDALFVALRREKLAVEERSLSSLSEILHFAHLGFEGGAEAVGDALGCHEITQIIDLVDERLDLCDLDAARIGPCCDVDTLFQELMWEKRHQEARRLQQFLDTIGLGFSETRVSNALGIFDTTALIELVEVRSDLVDLDAGLQSALVDELFQGIVRARRATHVQTPLEPNTALAAASTEMTVRVATKSPSVTRAPWAEAETRVANGMTDSSEGPSSNSSPDAGAQSSTRRDRPHDSRAKGGKNKGRGDGRGDGREGQRRDRANFGIFPSPHTCATFSPAAAHEGAQVCATPTTICA